jgi:hypothetical protein
MPNDVLEVLKDNKDVKDNKPLTSVLLRLAAKRKKLTYLSLATSPTKRKKAVL